MDGYNSVGEFDANYDYGGFSPAKKSMGCSPCKEFICSLDIKPGDKVRLSFRPEEEFLFFSLEEMRFFSVFDIKRDYVFKVIKEVTND